MVDWPDPKPAAVNQYCCEAEGSLAGAQIDAIAGKRTEGEGGAAEAGGVGVRLLSGLLTEMDGLEQATGVLVMGATNRPAALDAALCRPGRFDVVLYVPPPDEAGRLQALKIHTRGVPLKVGRRLCSRPVATMEIDCSLASPMLLQTPR